MAPFPTELLLIRHGEKEPVTPEDPDPPLTALGEHQADLLAARLADVQIDAVCSSTMRRARQTAAPLAASRGLAVAEFEDLREVDLGEWANGGFNEHAGARDAAWVEFARRGRWDAIPGSEGDDVFRARVLAVLEQLAGTYPTGRVAVVCHGGVVNAALAESLHLHHSFAFPVEHTSVSVLFRGGDHWFPRTVNDCHHLYDPAGSTVAFAP